jgi:lysophospholipase L1-like esterase
MTKGYGAPMRVVLLGDSHLARVRHDLHRIGDDVVNVAVGGALSDVLVAQASSAGITDDDIVVLSIGTNDAAPWKGLTLEAFTANVTHSSTQLVPGSGGGGTVRTADLIGSLGDGAFAEDGVHLTGAGYDLLLPAVRVAIRA